MALREDPVDPVRDRTLLRRGSLCGRRGVRAALPDGERGLKRVLFGATLPQFSGDRERLLAGVRAAEESGLDSIWVFDHLWPLSGGKRRAVFEGWTTLAWLAARTSSIRIGTLVTRSSLRHPPLLAKMAATVASIAPGRLILAMGSGDQMSRAENEAFGLPYYAGADRIGQLDAAADVLRSYFREPEISVENPFVAVRSLPTSPRPAVPPAVWIGGRADDVLAIAGKYADGWNGWEGTPAAFARDAQQVLLYAGGRDLELSWGGLAVLAADDASARARAGDEPSTELVGGPDTVAARLQGYVGAGARHLILTPAGSTGGPDFYRLLAQVAQRIEA